MRSLFSRPLDLLLITTWVTVLVLLLFVSNNLYKWFVEWRQPLFELYPVTYVLWICSTLKLVLVIFLRSLCFSWLLGVFGTYSDLYLSSLSSLRVNIVLSPLIVCFYNLYKWFVEWRQLLIFFRSVENVSANHSVPLVDMRPVRSYITSVKMRAR